MNFREFFWEWGKLWNDPFFSNIKEIAIGRISKNDMKSREKWVEYSKAKDTFFAHTDFEKSPWYMVNADDKRRARLNCIHHLLSLVPYKEIKHKKIDLPTMNMEGYVRPPISDQTFVPEVY